MEFQRYEEQRLYPVASTSTSQFPPTPPSFCDESCRCPSQSFVGWESQGCDLECCDPIECEIIDCSATDCAAAAQFHSIPPSDCNECWRNSTAMDPPAVGGSRKGKERVLEIETGLPRVSEGYGDLFSLDGQTLQEILDCCCCGPDSLPTPHDCHHIPHDPTHLIQPLSSASTSNSHSQISTPVLQSPSFPPIIFRCRWGSCDYSFSNKQGLVEHLNQDHLFLPKPIHDYDIVPLPPALMGTLHGSSGHDNCEECFNNIPALSNLPTLTHSPTSSTASSSAMTPLSYSTSSIHNFAVPPKVEEDPIKAATDLLVKHLLEKHLAGLGEGVVLAWATGLTQHSQPSSRRPSLASSNISSDSSSTVPAHQHLHPHSQRKSQAGPQKAHSHSHSHHGHPYGVHPRSASIAAPVVTPIPSSNGSHRCKWVHCAISFDSSSDLMQHLSTDHVGSGKATYSCEWDACDRKVELGKGFAQRQKVMRHLQTHTGDRPFVCDICSKSFSESTTLTQHKRVHTNERPYKCTHEGCDKTFALASALTIHNRTHTGDKPFKCDEPGCGSTFSESSNLSKHVRTHRAEKSHICDLCQKGFSRSDQLARHIKTHSKLGN